MPATHPPSQTLVVTGARGFLGRVMAREFARAGWHVVGVSRAGGEPIADCHVIEEMPTGAPAGLACEVLRKHRPTAVFHGAGSACVKASFEDPQSDLQASFGSWSTWLEACRLLETNRPLMIFPSSAAIYGRPEELPVSENARPKPISPYGNHKLLAELLAREYHEMHQVPAIVLRLFSVFGPSQRRLLIWELFDRLRQKNGGLSLQGTGREVRDYLHEQDVADVVLRFCSEPSRWQKATELPVFNLASGRRTEVRAAAEMMRDLMCPETEVTAKNEHFAGDPDVWEADVSRIRTAFPDWKPRGFSLQSVQDTLSVWGLSKMEGSQQ